jgi:poly(3-hydroxybutyrate) depolymerase
MHIRFKRLSVFIAFLLSVTCATAQSADQLPRLSIDPSGITVSGLSSGGFMAVQLHVAYSSTFKRGAGVVAGGPYYCTEGNPAYVERCMYDSSKPIPIPSLVEQTRKWAARKSIDPVRNLQSSRVYLFSGTKDPKVMPYVVDALQDYYLNFVPAGSIVYKKDIAAGHAMITDDFGGDCAATASPFINNCDFDLAGAILRHLYGDLNGRNDNTLTGSLMEFDQMPFITWFDMGTTGWVFIPKACKEGAKCRLHVALHGCLQNTAEASETFAEKTGYNRWADTNKIVVLYPRTGLLAANGCWDWWGYTFRYDFAQKSGLQMKAVKAMVDRLSGKDRRRH